MSTEDGVTEDDVIDNRQVVLRDKLLRILPDTSKASIAVGYFFISGFASISTPLKDVDKTRILISNTTNVRTAEALIEGINSIQATKKVIDETNFVNKDKREMVVDMAKTNVKKSLEHMTQTDDDKSVVATLLELMQAGKLEIRVYPKEKLHAKAYIFEPKSKGYVQGVGIVGSSNLSLAGLVQNSELNLTTSSSLALKKLLAWFNDLWDSSAEFTDEFSQILSKSWAGKVYSPYELFLKAAYIEHREKIEEQHKIDPVWESTFPTLFTFQRNAVDQALTFFERYRGVIIGDVVGLGKTYVGIALIKYLQLEGYRPLIICPPSLMAMWEKFCEEYEVDAKILSRGMLSQESFDLYSDYRYKSRDLILIDESHHFRNNNSRQYENLERFMHANDARAVLLTATPYANTPLDIKHQIQLFHPTIKTQIPPANVSDLDTYFKNVQNNSADLIEFLRNIMIRRTRRYVIQQWGGTDSNKQKYIMMEKKKMYFPHREMKTLRYDVNKVYKNKYATIVGYIDEENLTLARYSLGDYLKNEYKNTEPYNDLGAAGQKLVGLIRILLLKRMESSIEAFKSSIKHYINTHIIFVKLLEEGIVPLGDLSYKSMYELAESDPDAIDDPRTIDEFKSKIKRGGGGGGDKYKIEAFNVKSLIKAIQSDIETFKKINELIDPITFKSDDKLRRLQSLLSTNYMSQKVIIFTEFSTTARYLDEHLKWNGNKKQVDSKTSNIIDCARRFDPKNNPGLGPSIKKPNEISLLITTDVLAEGVNLQAGQVVINYDFHWNPTRLIQRAGRIDRINSVNKVIVIHNFLPDLEIEKDIHLESTVEQKINQIQRIIGEDYKILKESERINTADNYAIYDCDDSILDRENENPVEPTEIESMLHRIKQTQPELWHQIKAIPSGIRSSDPVGYPTGKLLLACESVNNGEILRKYYIVKSNRVHEIGATRALDLLKSNDKTPHALPEPYDRLVAAGWNKFISDVEQIEARSNHPRLSRSQEWAQEVLLKLSAQEKFKNESNLIETLRRGFSIPLKKIKLDRDLRKIRRDSPNDDKILSQLEDIYRHYGLQNYGGIGPNKSFPTRKILYSKWIGVKDANR